MKFLVDRLKKYNEIKSLEERFIYPFNPDSRIFTENEKELLNNEPNIFRRNVKLKELIKLKTNGSYSFTDLNFWIINEWGGIKTYKPNEKNIQKIFSFSDQLPKAKLTKGLFDTISSLSKISSFVDPENYVIYDSKVIYAINWLILTTDLNNIKFFPMPSGRNRKLVDFDINTIIRLSNLDKYSDNVLFYDYKVAYFRFCELIKSLSKSVFENDKIEPYYLEMLLFAIADNEIFNELTSQINIEIKT